VVSEDGQRRRRLGAKRSLVWDGETRALRRFGGFRARRCRCCLWGAGRERARSGCVPSCQTPPSLLGAGVRAAGGTSARRAAGLAGKPASAPGGAARRPGRPGRVILRVREAAPCSRLLDGEIEFVCAAPLLVVTPHHVVLRVLTEDPLSLSCSARSPVCGCGGRQVGDAVAGVGVGVRVVLGTRFG